ncbi:hypothetical protein EV184_10835 [Sinorhizobium americanum]|uniref:Uncharacterized protein n=1 Tax=Sinorhizobium americanum TaxID=194963 RepID=A0A4R2BVY3_9HYPH|nr:hypothetical protein EV184_10835 [Sinorhizobium americanum]
MNEIQTGRKIRSSALSASKLERSRTVGQPMFFSLPPVIPISSSHATACLRQSYCSSQYRASSRSVSRRTPCDSTLTVSFSGQRVALILHCSKSAAQPCRESTVTICHLQCTARVFASPRLFEPSRRLNRCIKRLRPRSLRSSIETVIERPRSGPSDERTGAPDVTSVVQFGGAHIDMDFPCVWTGWRLYESAALTACPSSKTVRLPGFLPLVEAKSQDRPT